MSSRYMLCFTAKLQNLTALQPQKGWDNGKEFDVMVECRGCNARTNIVVFAPADLTVTSTVNDFFFQCPTCNKVGTIRTIEGYGEPLMHSDTMKNPSADAMLFEAENFEPINCDFDSLWEAKSLSTIDGEKAYGPFDISGDGYFDYDEDKKVPVAASEMIVYFVPKYLAS
ncbi:hypothetical protein AAC387_Pa12g1285 [Persea americana]